MDSGSGFGFSEPSESGAPTPWIPYTPARKLVNSSSTSSVSPIQTGNNLFHVGQCHNGGSLPIGVQQSQQHPRYYGINGLSENQSQSHILKPQVRSHPTEGWVQVPLGNGATHPNSTFMFPNPYAMQDVAYSPMLRKHSVHSSSEAVGRAAGHESLLSPSAPSTPANNNVRNAYGIRGVHLENDMFSTGQQRQTENRIDSHVNRDSFQLCFTQGASTTSPLPYGQFSWLPQNQHRAVDNRVHGANKSVHFSVAPSTPCKYSTTQNSGPSEVIDLVAHEATKKKGLELNGNVHIEKEQSQTSFDLNIKVQEDMPPRDCVLLQLDNQKEAIEENQDIDLSKTPQQKPKRKKHRPKVIREGKPERKPRTATPKSAVTTSAEKPSGKRKYVRRKGVNVDIPLTENGQTIDTGNVTVRKATKRSLNFDSDVIGKNGHQQSCLRPMCTDAAEHVADVPKDDNSSSYKEKINTTKRVEEVESASTLLNLNEASKMAPGNISTSQEYSIPDSIHSSRESVMRNTEYLARLKGTIKNHSSFGSVLPSGFEGSNQFAPRTNNMISNGSLCSSGAASIVNKINYNLYLGADRHSYQNSAVHNSLLKQTANHTLNDNHVTYNGYQLNSLPSMSMGNKKENWSLGIVSSSTESTTNGQVQLSYPRNRTLSFAQSLAAVGKLQDAGHVVKHLHEQRKRKAQSMAPMPVCNQQMSTPRRFPAHAGRMSVNSRDQIVGNSQLTQPMQTTNQLLGANLLSLSSKVTCQQDVSFRCSSNQTQVGTTFQPQVKRSRNSSRKLNPPCPDLVEVVIQKLRCLTISDTSKCIDQGIQAQNAIVPYEANGTIVPFVPLSKRAIRPKVDLDPESNRVWMLLMGNEARDGADIMSKDKDKWWEEERRVFRGRIDSFIARMHLVQGDRRFSRWKGSVVDSVVGVFLTQNVTDHLSSSAFMSLAARFPPQSYGESRKSCIVEANSSQTNQPLSTVEIDDGVKQDVQSQRDIDQNFKLSCPSQNTKKKKNEEGIPSERDSIDGKTDVQSEIIGFGKEEELAVASPSNKITTSSAQCIHLNEVDDNISLESGPSSQNSVTSSQHSSDSPTPIVEPTALTADLNPDIEDLFSGNRWNCLEASTSFMQLLQMAGSVTSFHEPCRSVGVESAECYSREGIASPGFENQKTCQIDGIDNPCLPLDGNNSRVPIKEFNLTDASGGTCVSSTSRMLAHSGLPGLKSVDEVRKIKPSFTSFTSGVTNETCRDFCGNVNVALVKNAAEYQKKSTVASPSLCVLDSGTAEFISNSNAQHKFSKTAYSRATESQRIERTDLWKNKENNTLSQPKYSIHEHSALHSELVPSACVSDNSKPPSTVEMEKIAVRNGTELISPDASFSNNVPSEKGRGAVKPVRRKFDKARKACDWDTLRKEVNCSSTPERNSSANDTVDWEAVRAAKVEEVSNTIRERGMNNMLAERIKDFLDRLVQDHESIDLEWLRDVPPDKAKDYLLSIRGLGLKSVECIRLLTLHHLAFPVDTNVGRICVRLGWVPLQPLPESLQMHLLELYPMLETIQKYLWPRLCTLDQRTLYELHYQLITFGKVFCTKHKPNCNACPMRGECKHFASAFASARLALPGPEEKGLVTSMSPIGSNINEKPTIYSSPLPQIEGNAISQGSAVSSETIQAEGNAICQRPVVTTVPIIEEPATPEPEPEPESEYLENLQSAIERDFYEDPDEIPTIKLNVQQFTQNLQDIMQHKNIQEGDMSKALVALTPEAASIPQPKLKNINRLRTEHQVYELPDSHPLLKGLEQRQKDDPCPYLLSIWTPGETAQSTDSPDLNCTAQDRGKLCDRKICFSCNSAREDQAQKVRGTILIPCRTAMRGSFPLNGTYFQVNEVFADHRSSINPIDVPREWIWNLPRRTVYFGTSVTSIFRGLTTEGIQQCFWKGFVCVRGFDQITRAPRPLFARLHLAASKVIRNKKTPMKEDE